MGEREASAPGGRAGAAGIDRAVLRDPAARAAVDATPEDEAGGCAESE